jgi:hypothetical protein
VADAASRRACKRSDRGRPVAGGQVAQLGKHGAVASQTCRDGGEELSAQQLDVEGVHAWQRVQGRRRQLGRL